MKLYEKIKDYYNKISWQGKLLLFSGAFLASGIRGAVDGYSHGYRNGRADERQHLENCINGSVEAIDTIEKCFKDMGFDQKVDSNFLREFMLYKESIEEKSYRPETEQLEKQPEPRSVEYNDYPC